MYDSIAQNKRATHLLSALAPARAPAIVLAILAALFALMLLADPASAQTLTVVKSDAGNDPVTVGKELTYTITVSSAGGTANNVDLEDVLPANTTFVSADVTTGSGSCIELAPGANSGTITCDLNNVGSGGKVVTLVVKPTAAAGVAGFVSNTATADADNAGPATDTESTTVNPSPITITKDDDPDPADVGEALLYTLIIKNTSGTSENLVVEDELPDEVDFLDVDPNGDCEETNNLVTCDLTVNANSQKKVQILVEPQEDGTITNTAQVFFADDLDTPLDEASENTTVDDNGGGGGGGSGGGGSGGGSGSTPRDRARDLQRALDDLNNLDGENSTLESEQYSGEDTLGSNGSNSGVSAAADQYGAEASTPGASASANGDEDTEGPVGPQGDVVDEVPTSGPLPDTGGVPVATGTVLALVLFGAGLLAVRLVMLWRGRRT